MKDRKIKKGFIIGAVIFIIVILLAVFGYKYMTYLNSNLYKLKKVGYTKEEITLIEKKYEKKIPELLKKEYNSNISKLMNEKYFIYNNLDRYLSYQKDKKEKDLTKVVTMVNVKRDYEYYDPKIVKKTDLADGNLILVNKYYYLDKSFAPEDIVEVSNWYCYGENEIRKEVYEKFRSMYNDGLKDNVKLIINSSYRTYDHQETLWNSYSNSKGEEWADSIAARPGYSEHQTGLTLDITSKDGKMDTFDQSEEFKWLEKNAHKYGFILRYPKGKEEITGYSYESWHYRYVGEEIASKIKELGITYDEYYAYYIEK